MDFAEPLRDNPRYKFLKKLNQGTLTPALQEEHSCPLDAAVPVLSLSQESHKLSSPGAFGFVVLARRLEDGSLCAVKFMQRGTRITKYVSREFINHRSDFNFTQMIASPVIRAAACWGASFGLTIQKESSKSADHEHESSKHKALSFCFLKKC